jgi:hypothetical protein
MGQHMTMQKPPPAVSKPTGNIPRLPRFQQRRIAVITDNAIGSNFVKMLAMKVNRMRPSGCVDKVDCQRFIPSYPRKGLA